LHQVLRPRQPSGDVCRAHKLNVSKRKLHLVEVKNCEDTRPGLESHPSHHPSWCERLCLYLKHSASSCRARSQFTEALKLHAHSVHYANKLTTTRRTLEKTSCSEGLDLVQGTACHPPDAQLFFYFLADVTALWPMCLHFFN